MFEDDRYYLTTQEEAKNLWTIEACTERIKRFNEQEGKVILVAEDEDFIAGQVSIECGDKDRIKHVGSLGIIVRHRYRGVGLGRKLVEYAIEWARQDKLLEKIGLCVHSTNKTAIDLYVQMGFIEEGRRVKEVKFANGKYADSVEMYRFVK